MRVAVAERLAAARRDAETPPGERGAEEPTPEERLERLRAIVDEFAAAAGGRLRSEDHADLYREDGPPC